MLGTWLTMPSSTETGSRGSCPLDMPWCVPEGAHTAAVAG